MKRLSTTKGHPRRSLRIVAIDIGRCMGWAASGDGESPTRWGRVLFSEDRAERLRDLSRWLRGNESPLHGADVVVYETPFCRGRAATRSMWGAAGVIEACATEAGCAVLDVAVPTIKKFATGSGTAPKNAMIEAAGKLGYKGRDDNEADAFCLLRYAEEHLEVGD